VLICVCPAVAKMRAINLSVNLFSVGLL